MTDPKALIETLNLARHPEGGWFRETFRQPAPDGGRGLATAILFLLEAGERSHWHRVDAAEIWLWHAGDPVVLEMSPTGDGPIEQVTLGPDVLAGDEVQKIIPPDCWQAAHTAPGATAGYALVSCIVSPAFDFAGFTLAAPDWAPGQ